MHDSTVCEVVDRVQECEHVVLDAREVQLGEVGQEWLGLLVFKDKGDLPVEPEALNQIGIISLPVQQL